jgi:hypothetical protein
MTRIRNINDDRGVAIDATFSVAAEPGHQRFSLYWESQGGRAGGPNPRNLAYRRGLELALKRLQGLSVTIDEVQVETRRTLTLPISERRISIPGLAFPVSTAGIRDIASFRISISKAARKVGQSSDLAAQGGGSSRRMRLLLSEVKIPENALAEFIAHGPVKLGPRRPVGGAK